MIKIFVLTFAGVFPQYASAQINETQWTAPSGRIWISMPVSKTLLPYEIYKTCADRGMTIPQTSNPDVEQELNQFVSGPASAGLSRLLSKFSFSGGVRYGAFAVEDSIARDEHEARKRSMIANQVSLLEIKIRLANTREELEPLKAVFEELKAELQAIENTIYVNSTTANSLRVPNSIMRVAILENPQAVTPLGLELFEYSLKWSSPLYTQLESWSSIVCSN